MKQFFAVLAAATAVTAAPTIVQDLLGAMSSGVGAVKTQVADPFSDAFGAVQTGAAEATIGAGGLGDEVLGDLNGLLAGPTADTNDINIPLPPLVTGIPGLSLPGSLFVPLPNDFDPAKFNLTPIDYQPLLEDMPRPKIPTLPLSPDELAEIEEGDRFRFTILIHPKSVDVTIAPEAGSANSTTNGTAPAVPSANGTNTTVTARNTSTEVGSSTTFVNKPGEKKIGFWEVKAAPKMATALPPRPIDLAALSFDLEKIINQPELWLFTKELKDNFTTEFDAAKYQTELEDYFKTKKFNVGNNTNITADIMKAVEKLITETVTQLNETMSLWEGVHLNSKMKAVMTFVNGTNSAHQAVRIIGLEKPPTVGADGTVSWTWAVEALLNETLSAGVLENPSIVLTDAYCTRQGFCCQFEACPRYDEPGSVVSNTGMFGGTGGSYTNTFAGVGGYNGGDFGGPTFETMSDPMAEPTATPTKPVIISDPAEAFLGPTATGGTVPMIISDPAEAFLGPTVTGGTAA